MWCRWSDSTICRSDCSSNMPDFIGQSSVLFHYSSIPILTPLVSVLVSAIRRHYGATEQGCRTLLGQVSFHLLAE